MRISDWSSDVCSSDLQEGADRIGSADGAEQLVSGGVVALLHRAIEKATQRRAVSLSIHQRDQRLMEKRQVLSADYGVVIERQLAAIHGVEQSHRDPELRHALLRKQFVAVIIDHPVRIDALDGNADMTIEIPAQIMDDLEDRKSTRLNSSH